MLLMSKRVLLVTFDKYPDGDAGAVRVHMFGKMCLEMGCFVEVVSMGPTTQYQRVAESDGIEHISFRGKSNSKLSKAMYYILFASRLKRHLHKNVYDAVIHTQLDEQSLHVLQMYGKKHQIPIIFDSVEWFSESQFSRGAKARAYKRNNRYNTCLIKPPSSVVAISEYLESHFKNRGIRTVRIPVVLDTKETNVVKSPSQHTITLLYAGSPGKKDCLDSIIRAIAGLDEAEKSRFRFVILGCTRENLILNCGVTEQEYENAKEVLVPKGRVSRSQVIEEYKKADFSVLLRYSEQRYAKAGFPTKFVESLCCGSPVICNISSDLAHYAVNRKNAIILKDIGETEIIERLREILSFSPKKLDSMKSYARETAETMFDYHLYTSTLKELVISEGQ